MYHADTSTKGKDTYFLHMSVQGSILFLPLSGFEKAQTGVIFELEGKNLVFHLTSWL